MPVYYAYTRNGDQFDGTVALNAQNAEQIIRYRYSNTKNGMHFVGDREQTAEELLDGMRIEHMPHILEADHLIVEQRAEEDAAVSSDKTLRRVLGAINDQTSRLQERAE